MAHTQDTTEKLPLISDKNMQSFLRNQDLEYLDTPLVFEKNPSFVNFLASVGIGKCLVSSLATAFACPIGTFCPSRLYDHFELELHKDSVKFKYAENDCCFHIADSQRTVPLEKVQDVSLNENWVLTCCGLKQLKIETAGQGTIGSEVSAAFLKNPEQARDCVQLAVKLRQGLAPAAAGALTVGPPAEVMNRSAKPRLEGRLQQLSKLVELGIIPAQQASDIKVAVLVADLDITELLLEAVVMAKRELMTANEVTSLRDKLVLKITKGSK